MAVRVTSTEIITKIVLSGVPETVSAGIPFFLAQIQKSSIFLEERLSLLQPQSFLLLRLYMDIEPSVFIATLFISEEL